MTTPEDRTALIDFITAEPIIPPEGVRGTVRFLVTDRNGVKIPVTIKGATIYPEDSPYIPEAIAFCEF